MKQPRKRTVLLVLGSILLLAAAVGGWASAAAIRELWLIRRLASPAAGERARTASRLREVGSMRAAAAIARAIVDRRLGDSGLEALEGIFPRLDPPRRARILEVLLEMVREEPDRESEAVVRLFPKSAAAEAPGRAEAGDELSSGLFGQFLVRSAASLPPTFPALLRKVEEGKANLLPATIFARAWPAAAEMLTGFLGRAPADRAEALLDAVQDVLITPGPERMFGGTGATRPAADGAAESIRAAARSILLSLARDHPRAEVRALALAKVIFQNDEVRPPPHVLDEAFGRDPDLRVRRAAIRLAGTRGFRADDLDPMKLLLADGSPELLADVIGARTLWATGGDIEAVELAGGLVSRVAGDTGKGRPLAAGEVTRLEAILAARAEPAVRDAASTALAAADRAPFRDGEPPADGGPDLEVHEWGILADRGSSAGPLEAWIRDLPPFVARSRSTIDRMLRPDEPADDDGDGGTPHGADPVIFFHGSRPASLVVRVRFLGGRPWAFHPDATDYPMRVSGDRQQASRFRRELLSILGPEAGETADADPALLLPPADVPGVCPPWLTPKDLPLGEAPPVRRGRFRKAFIPGAAPREQPGVERYLRRGEMRSKGPLVPWCFPRKDSPPDENMLRGIGLEWKGLRVGYPPALEGDATPATGKDGPGRRWERLRRVAATSIALRGSSEKFLAYEGAVRFPPPVAVRWSDSSKTALRIRARDFLALPRPDDWQADGGGNEGAAAPTIESFPGVFVIRRTGGGPARGASLGRLPSRSDPIDVALDRLDLDPASLRARLTEVLLGEGLATDEVEALLDAADPEMSAAGLRVISVLPRWLYDAVLPLEIEPAPRRTVRVGLLWKECDRLDVENPPEGPGGMIPFGKPERLETAASTIEVRRSPLDPGPPEPLPVDADGRLLDFYPANYTMLLAADGKHIAHPRDGLRGSEMYLLDLEARTVRRLVLFRGPGRLVDYAISGDGGRVNVLMRFPDSWRVFVADAVRGELLEVIGPWGELEWSFLTDDGRHLSFLDGGKMVVVDLEAGRAVSPVLPAGTRAFLPMLTPDGSKASCILATANRREETDENGEVTVVEEESGRERRAVALLDLAAGTRVRISKLPSGGSYPDISADGRRILFGSREGQGSWLYLAELDARRFLRIAPHDADIHLHNLTRDGRRVLYATRTSVWTVDAATGKARPAWSAPPGRYLQDACASADGKKVLVEIRGAESRAIVEVRLVDVAEK